MVSRHFFCKYAREAAIAVSDSKRQKTKQKNINFKISFFINSG